MKFFKMLIVVIGALLLSGCQEETPIVSHQGYIADIESNRILVGDIFFSIDEAKLVTDKRKSIQSSDLRVGMEVRVQFDGMVAESLPGQAKASKVTIGTHADNKRAEEAVRAIVQFAEKQYGKPILIQYSDTIDIDHFLLEIRVFTEDEPIKLQYDFDTKIVSME
jgi:hypothetical protein